MKEFDETRKQIEEDADREIEQQRHDYEEKLANERQNSLRLKGENNLMGKKFATLQKEIEDLKEEIGGLNDQKKQLYQQIHLLEKEIGSQKKEIRDRYDAFFGKMKS